MARASTTSQIGKLARVLTREMMPVAQPAREVAANFSGAAGGNVGIVDDPMTRAGDDGSGNAITMWPFVLDFDALDDVRVFI
jgi:hypothetical protein